MRTLTVLILILCNFFVVAQPTNVPSMADLGPEPIGPSQNSAQFNIPVPKGFYIVKLNRPAKTLSVKVTID